MQSDLRPIPPRRWTRLPRNVGRHADSAPERTQAAHLEISVDSTEFSRSTGHLLNAGRTLGFEACQPGRRACRRPNLPSERQDPSRGAVEPLGRPAAATHIAAPPRRGWVMVIGCTRQWPFARGRGTKTPRVGRGLGWATRRGRWGPSRSPRATRYGKRERWVGRTSLARFGGPWIRPKVRTNLVLPAR
jgi:hypothetical protein